MKKFKVGDQVILDQFKCVITNLFEDNGKEYATVKPVEFNSFEREVEISRIKRIKKKSNRMKTFAIGFCLGAVLIGSFASIATNNYVKLVNNQEADIVALQNEIAHLEFTNKQLMNENYQLSEQVK